jgi:hypothetical protein
LKLKAIIEILGFSDSFGIGRSRIILGLVALEWVVSDLKIPGLVVLGLKILGLVLLGLYFSRSGQFLD